MYLICHMFYGKRLHILQNRVNHSIKGKGAGGGEVGWHVGNSGK